MRWRPAAEQGWRSVKQGRAAEGASHAAQAVPDKDTLFHLALWGVKVRSILHRKGGKGNVCKNPATCCPPSQLPRQNFVLPYQQQHSLRTEGSKTQKGSSSDCPRTAQLHCKGGAAWAAAAAASSHFTTETLYYTGIVHPRTFLHSAGLQPSAHEVRKCFLMLSLKNTYTQKLAF